MHQLLAGKCVVKSPIIASPSSVPLAIPRTPPCSLDTDASGHAPRTTADRWGDPDSANHRVVPLRVLLHNLIHDLAELPDGAIFTSTPSTFVASQNLPAFPVDIQLAYAPVIDSKWRGMAIHFRFILKAIHCAVTTAGVHYDSFRSTRKAHTGVRVVPKFIWRRR